ncbi:MAG: hypothetical protein OXF79_01945 [Chloroflexi bacterium]|nr:hypothetical protein [Chloroflexota bacterium]
MPDRHFNPFQTIDINVPVEFHEQFQRYCRSGGGGVVDQSPFPRMIDLWFLALCVAARSGLRPVDVSGGKTWKMIDGTIFSRDPWRIHALILLAVAKTGDVNIASEPRKVMRLANGLAVAGLPRVLEMLKDGGGEPLWNLSDGIDGLLEGANDP